MNNVLLIATLCDKPFDSNDFVLTRFDKSQNLNLAGHKKNVSRKEKMKKKNSRQFSEVSKQLSI